MYVYKQKSRGRACGWVETEVNNIFFLCVCIYIIYRSLLHFKCDIEIYIAYFLLLRTLKIYILYFLYGNNISFQHKEEKNVQYFNYKRLNQCFFLDISNSKRLWNGNYKRYGKIVKNFYT